MFSFSNPFDADVEKATNEKNTTEDWGLILDICDKVTQTQTNAKYCLKSIIKRLNNADPHVVLKAVTLLDACVNNCGKPFHLEVASRDFEGEFRKLVTKSHPTVQQKLKELLKTWAEGEFKSDPQLNLIPSLYSKLRQEGIDFNPPPDMALKKSTQLSKDPNVASNQQEVDDIAKAIELSLKEKSGSPRTTVTSTSGSSSLYPTANLSSSSTAPSGVPSDARKVRALYDFEAAEDNELTFLAGEIIHVIDDSDQNWWKGYNQRGEGLFPANFVTADLSVEPEQIKVEQKKSVAFQDQVTVRIEKTDPEDIEIDEEKIDRLLHLLHEADPSDDRHDTEEMLNLEEQVNNMGPLIDAELERVDRKHAQLTQLSSDLVEALNLYHTLMREPQYSTLPKTLPFQYPQPTNAPVRLPNLYNGMPSHTGTLPQFSQSTYSTMLPGSAPTNPIPSGPDNRPPFMSMPPGGPPMPPNVTPTMNMPPHFQMPPGMVPSMPPEDRLPPNNLPPQFPARLSNYGPPGATYSASQIVPPMAQQNMPPQNIPPSQNFGSTPSSQHLM